MVSHPLCLPLSHPPRMCPRALPAGGPLAGCPIPATSPLPAKQPHPAALPESRCSEDPPTSSLWMQVCICDSCVCCQNIETAPDSG